jgi:hypothetical protein
MKCRNCQNEIENGIKFCPYCGSAVEAVVENATLEEAVDYMEMQENEVTVLTFNLFKDCEGNYTDETFYTNILEG